MVDKNLQNGQGYYLTDESNDMKTVGDEDSILQAIQNRILSERGSWVYDDEYGSTLYSYLRSGKKLTASILFEIVSLAVQPMIKDGRVTSVDEVKLLKQEDTTAIFEVSVTIGNQEITQNYTVNYI